MANFLKKLDQKTKNLTKKFLYRINAFYENRELTVNAFKSILSKEYF